MGLHIHACACASCLAPNAGEFADANEELLKSLPPPYVAAQYYLSADLYLFDDFQTSQARTAEPRRPPCNTLYDVFINIRDDEGEHVKTMAACQDTSIMADLEVRRDTERRP
jgi:ubiquinol oxidase